MKIGLTNIYVNSPTTAFKFYTEKLDFVKVMYMPERNLAVVASKEDPEGTALLLEPTNNPTVHWYQSKMYQAGIPAIVLLTKDIRGEYNRLAKLGIVFRKKPTKNDWGIEAIFDDTCGNFIQLSQKLD